MVYLPQPGNARAVVFEAVLPEYPLIKHDINVAVIGAVGFNV